MASARSARATRPAAASRPPARPRALAGGLRASGIRWDRVGRAMLIGMFGIVAVLYISPLLSVWSTRGEAARRRADVVRLQQEHQRLERRMAALKSPKALEREARRLGMVRPGERAYVVKGLPGN